jgi:hypothetical protein
VSTFDSSSQKVGHGLNVDTTVLLMNALAVHTEKALYSPGSPTASANTTYLATASKTANYASDETLVMIATLYYSISNGVNTEGRMGIHVNGVLYENDFSIGTASSGVGGNDDFRMMIKVGQFPGSTTVDLRFSRNTGSGTVYAGFATLDILAVKYRPS